MSAPTLALSLLGTLGWTAEQPGDSTPAGPEQGAGGLVVPGFTPPARPHLQLSCGAEGVVAWFGGSGAGGRAVFRIVDGAVESIPFTEEVRGAAGRAEGAWVLGADALYTVDRAGRVGTAERLSAVRLLGAGSTRGAVWALGSDSASFVAPDGSTRRFAAPWSNPLAPAAYGDSIIGWDPDHPDSLLELGPDGAVRSWLAGFEPRPLERLLAYDGSTALLTVLRGLRRAGQVDDTLEVLGGGGTDDQGVFVAVRTMEGAWLFRSDDQPRLLRLAEDERVLAVSGDRVLAASRTKARWLASGDGSAIADGDAVVFDEQSYAVEVEPYAWQLAPGFSVQARSPTQLVLSASGPNGVVVGGVEWLPGRVEL